MKEIIKKVLREAVGVPRGIEVSAKAVYEDYMSIVKSSPKKVLNDKTNLDTFDGKYDFSDYNITDLSVGCSYSEINYPTYEVLGLTISKVSRIENLRLKWTTPNNIEIVIQIGVPESENENPDPVKVINLLDKKKTYLISSLAHELKHGYDEYKEDTRDLSKSVEYRISSDNRFDNKIIDRFMFDNYYIHNYESLVRPTEMYSLALEKGITKKDFLTFVTETDTFKILKRISEYGYEDFRKNLKDNINFIEEVIINVNERMPNNDESKIDLFLKIFHNTLLNKKINLMTTYLETTVNPFALFFGETSHMKESEKFFEKFKKKVLKYENNENKFFQDVFKHNQLVATNMIKRISKVYSLLEFDTSINDPASLKIALKEYDFFPNKRANYTNKRLF
jgi:hypothetical protein